jgi:uncharacterized membrane protein HdeD (DUF308 family)
MFEFERKGRKRFGWLQLVLGILLMLAGVYAMLHPVGTVSGEAFLYGVAAVVTGAVDILLYIHLERRTGFGPVFSLVTGIFSLLAGVLILLRPGAGRWYLVILFPVWFLAHCLSNLARLPLTRWVIGSTNYYISLVLNILGLIISFMMMFSPVLSMLSLPLLISGYLILLGADSVVSAVQTLRNC